jgi:hypothetical protein
VSPPDLQTFTHEVLCDNRLAAGGQKLPLEAVVQLRAEIEAVFMLANLERRGLDLVKQHRELWKRTLQFFEAALAIWEGVPPDGELVSTHRRELERLAEIAKDRVLFYSIDGERRDYMRRKAE